MAGVTASSVSLEWEPFQSTQTVQYEVFVCCHRCPPSNRDCASSDSLFSLVYRSDPALAVRRRLRVFMDRQTNMMSLVTLAEVTT